MWVSYLYIYNRISQNCVVILQNKHNLVLRELQNGWLGGILLNCG